MGSLLDDIDDIIDDGDVVVNCSYEIENAITGESFKNLNMMKSNSTKYSILKKNKKDSWCRMSNIEIFSMPWECESVLKYFDMNEIYKGAEIVMLEFKITRGAFISNGVEFFIIFRGHNKRKDNAICISTAYGADSYKVLMKHALSAAAKKFLIEHAFNAVMNNVRHYLKMDTKFFKFLKHENA